MGYLNTLINPPPTKSNLVDEKGAPKNNWSGWFSNVNNVLNQFFPVYTQEGGNTGASLHKLVSLTTVERDALQNIDEGVHIFNKTTKKVNYYDGTNWIAI